MENLKAESIRPRQGPEHAMNNQLVVACGQYSDKGRKPSNQDFHAVMIPEQPLLDSKGIAVAIADGISSSDVSHIASEISVKSFLQDYTSTPESWSVKTSAHRVLQATNSWLYAQTRSGPYRYTMDRGYVCTFSALVLKSNTAHLFHAGDTRIYLVAGNRLQQLTEDHRVRISRQKSYLSQALGMRERLDFDYQTLAIEEGDIFILTTDGVHEFAEESFIVDTIANHAHDLDEAARLVVERALRNGSADNLTVQIIRVEGVPARGIDELQQQTNSLPLPPPIRPRMVFDGYEIVREIHSSSRSHVYLAIDNETRTQVVLKVPSVDLREDSAYMERFLMEEWIARRLDNVHVLRAWGQTRKRNYLYTVSEYIEGLTLSQWMNDNPNPDLESVRNIVEQIAKGLYALHRQEMLHQDLRPNNIMIDKAGTVILIDFGSVRVAGIAEISITGQQHILGTMQYTAPEYFLGEAGTVRSDLFSLAVITYQMLSGRLPYGTQVAKISTRAAQRKLLYRSLLDDKRAIPPWIDGAIRKALQPNPGKRQDELSEFVYELRHPNAAYLRGDQAPLLERNPLLFWKALSFGLFLLVIFLSATHFLTNNTC